MNRRGQLPSLDERAETEERRIFRLRRTLLAFGMALTIIVPFVFAKQINDNYIANLDSRIDNLTKQISEDRPSLLSKVNSFLQNLKSANNASSIQNESWPQRFAITFGTTGRRSKGSHW